MAMHTWFECKIRYEKLMENGMNKKVTEPYLVDALYFMNAWWYTVYPGAAIFITVLVFNVIGDGLREVLDPKTRKI